MTTGWKNSCFILSDFHMDVNWSIAVHALPMHIWTSLSVDEILLPKNVKWSTNFRGLPFNAEMAPSLFACCLIAYQPS